MLLRVVKKVPVALLALIKSMQDFKYGWCSDVLSDVQWMSFDKRVLGQRPTNLTQCIDAWRGDFKAATSSVKRFCQSPVANLVHNWAVSVSLIHSNDFQACHVCHQTFKSTQALTLHQLKSHGLMDPIRCFVPTTCCCICLKEFGTRPLNPESCQEVCGVST